MGFTASILLAIIILDIFPEIISQLKEKNSPSIETMIALVIGFMLFHILEKVIVIHH